MADIELVIKISQESYNNLKIGCTQRVSDGEMIEAIKNGIPLPKGHGTLKDTDAICKDIIRALGIRDESYLLHAENAIYKRIKNADAIIKADNTESEVKE